MKDKSFFEPGKTYVNQKTGKTSIVISVDDEKVQFHSCAVVQKSHGHNHKYILYYAQCQNYELVKPTLES